MESLYLLKRYPYLIHNFGCTKWSGFIRIKNVDIYLHIECKNYPSLESMTIILTDNLLWLFVKPHLEQVKLTSTTLAQFLDKFTTFLEPLISKCYETDDICTDMSLNHFYKMSLEILTEIESNIGQANVQHISTDFSNITLSTSDNNGKSHILYLSLPHNYPNSSPSIIDVDLPRICIDNINEAKTMSVMYKKFCDVVNHLHDYWSLYSSLYSVCTVVDPLVPKYSNTQCKIALGNGVLLAVSFNPLDPFACPELNLIGAKTSTEIFRHSIEDNIKEIGWEPQNDFCYNLLNILGLDEFPRSDVTCLTFSNNADISITECSICFSFQTEDNAIPVKLCSNSNCKAHFHESCLSKWFLAIPMNEPSFDIITGPCPLCTKKIPCPVK